MTYLLANIKLHRYIGNFLCLNVHNLYLVICFTIHLKVDYHGPTLIQTTKYKSMQLSRMVRVLGPGMDPEVGFDVVWVGPNRVGEGLWDRSGAKFWLLGLSRALVGPGWGWALGG